MKKLRVEVCLISARGLGRTSSLWMKLQWYAVGWIDPNNKYCTKVDSSGTKNPTWKTKFSALINDDYDEDDRNSPSLHVQVYSREPLFLREKLQGTATVLLKEFVSKYYSAMMNNSLSGGVEEVGSFQLRKKGSGKPQGFVDVSIRISEERDDGRTLFPNYYSGNNGEGFEVGSGGPTNSEIYIGDGMSNVDDHNHNHHSNHSLRRPPDHLQPRPTAAPLWSYPQQPHPTDDQVWSYPQQPRPTADPVWSYPQQPRPTADPVWSYPQQPRHTADPVWSYPQTTTYPPHPAAPSHQNQPQRTTSDYHPVGYSTTSNDSNLQPPSLSATRDGPNSNRPPPPPPPPPSHVGYIPTFLPRAPATYMNNRPGGGVGAAGHAGSGGGGAGSISGFGMGMSGGAMAAGAVLFGDDFMSGFDVPPGVLP